MTMTFFSQKMTIFFTILYPSVLKGQTKNQHCKGFTLIEVLVAITIFSIGILGVAQLQLSSVSGNATSRMQTEATIFISDRIEQLMAAQYNDAVLDPANNPQTDVQDEYTITWNVTDNTPAINTKTIRVVVDWNTRGKNRQDRIINIDFIKANL